jgi:hypothetical protein
LEARIRICLTAAPHSKLTFFFRFGYNSEKERLVFFLFHLLKLTFSSSLGSETIFRKRKGKYFFFFITYLVFSFFFFINYFLSFFLPALKVCIGWILRLKSSSLEPYRGNAYKLEKMRLVFGVFFKKISNIIMFTLSFLCIF